MARSPRARGMTRHVLQALMMKEWMTSSEIAAVLADAVPPEVMARKALREGTIRPESALSRAIAGLLWAMWKDRSYVDRKHIGGHRYAYRIADKGRRLLEAEIPRIIPSKL